MTPARFVLAPCAPPLAETGAHLRDRAVGADADARRPAPGRGEGPPRQLGPGRALITGFVGGPPALDDWDKFDVPGLRGIARTAPYFHNNSAATLEEMVDHYIEFFKRVQANAVPGGLVPPIATTDGVHFDRAPTPEERAALIAYMRKL